MSTAQSYRKNKVLGFTLIELLVVVLILGALAAIVIPRFMNVEEMAEQNALSANIGQVNEVINAHFQMSNEIPDGLDAIVNPVDSTIPAPLNGVLTAAGLTANEVTALQNIGLNQLYNTATESHFALATGSKVGKMSTAQNVFVGGGWQSVGTDVMALGIGSGLMPNDDTNVTISFDRIGTDPGLTPNNYRNFLILIRFSGTGENTTADYLGCIDPMFTGG